MKQTRNVSTSYRLRAALLQRVEVPSLTRIAHSNYLVLLTPNRTQSRAIDVSCPRNPRVDRSRRIGVEQRHGIEAGNETIRADVERVFRPSLGVVAPLWLRANAPMVVADVCSTMKYPKRSQYKHGEAEEVPRSQLGGIQRRAAPPRRFDGLV